MKIGVIGLGFVGLTTALGFSYKGIRTMGFDLDFNKLNKIKSMQIPFYESKLNDVLIQQLGNNFKVTNSLKELVVNSDILFICVGTPKGINGKADLAQIKTSLDGILDGMDENDSKIILIKSTIPPSTTDELCEYIRRDVVRMGTNVSLGVNPEFLREGHSWEDFMNPDKIIVGFHGTEIDRKKIEDIYCNFGVGVTFTNPRTAEFLKYLSNTLLSTLISFSNEMSIIGKKIGGIDISEAFNLLHLDSRFYGNPAGITSYIYPGCGYGGYCLPKDTEAIVSLSKSLGFNPLLLERNIEINETIMDFWINEFEKEYCDKEVNIGILGLSFKPDSDDIRETPARKCINLLKQKGFNNIQVYDPKAMANFAKTYPDIEVSYALNSKELVNFSKIIFIITAWEEFTKIDYSNKILYNLRNIPIQKSN